MVIVLRWIGERRNKPGVEGFLESGERQRETVQGSRKKYRTGEILRGFCCQNDLELVAIYDFV